jgi:DNA-binding SARP family transcriptional activator
MRCLARAGERTQALKQYERLTALLRADLEAEPDEETTVLYDRLRRAEAV